MIPSYGFSQKQDKPLARAIRSALTTIGLRWWQLRNLEIYLDTASQATTPALWSSVEEKLKNSKFLILLASRDACSSVWVEKEVSTFLSLPDRSLVNVLLVLTDGELTWDTTQRGFSISSDLPLPPCLRNRFSEQPHWVDLREFRNADRESTKRDPEFLGKILDLAATIHGTRKEDLYSEEVRQQRQNMRLAIVAIFTLAVLSLISISVGAFAWYRQAEAIAERIEATNQRVEATAQRNEATAQRNEATAQRNEATIQKNEAKVQRDKALRSQSLFLADAARQHLASGDATTAMLLSLEGLPDEDSQEQASRERPYVVQDEYTLNMGRRQSRERTTIAMGGMATRILLNADGSLFLAQVVPTGRDEVFTELRSVSSGARLARFDLELSSQAIAWFLADKFIVTASKDIALWNPQNGTLSKVLRGHLDKILHVSASSDYKLLVSASLDRTARIWNLAQDSVLPLVGHKHAVERAYFALSNKVVVTISLDGTIRTWDASTGQPIKAVNYDGLYFSAIPVRAHSCIQPNDRLIFCLVQR